MRSWARNPSTAFFEMALDRCRDLVFVKNDKSQIIYANEMMRKLYSPAERDSVIGSDPAETVSSEAAAVILASDREALDRGFSEIVQHVTDHSGRRVTLSTRKTRFLDDDGNVRILVIATDITHVSEQAERLSRSNQALERFASLAAHDLVSPLGTASLMLETIKMARPPEGKADYAQSIEEVIGVINGAARKVGAVLTLQKAMISGTLRREPTLLSAVVREVEAMLQAQIVATEARVVVNPLPTLYCEPVLVEALMQNLVENALKYRSDDALTITISHRVRNGRDVISVVDNGMGMTDGDKKRVFRLFEQGNGHHESGLGIGLALCRDVVEVHGGAIWIDTDCGEGTRINFTLSETGKGMDEGDREAGDTIVRAASGHGWDGSTDVQEQGRGFSSRTGWEAWTSAERQELLDVILS